MIIKLLSTQIPEHWELIKFTIVSVDDVEKKHLQPYLNEILNDLLSDKAQCFFRIDQEQRKVLTVFIVQTEGNKVTGERIFLFRNLYAFDLAQNSDWERYRDFFIQFAKKQGCTSMMFRANLRRAWELGEMLGFEEDHRAYVYHLR